MKFDLEDHRVALNHVVLNNRELAIKVADTDLWKSEGKLEAKVFINGVEFDGQLIEDVLQTLYKRCEESYKIAYDVDKFEERVEERAKVLLKEHANNALGHLYNLTNYLEQAEDMLVPHWERK